MSDDLDRFVLQYSVELKDSIKKLEDLQKKMAGVGAENKKAQEGLKDFAGKVTNELGRLIPGIDAVGSAVGRLAAGFGAAAVAVGGLALAIKAVNKLRQEFETQRKAGIDLGISGFRVEEYQRKIVGSSAANFSREQALNELLKLRQRADAAYAQPGSPEALRMKALGINPGVVGGKSTGTNDIMKQLGAKMAGLTDEQVKAIAYATGENEDFLKVMKDLGPTIGHVTEQTQADLDARRKAEAEVKQLNADLATFEEATHRLWQELGKLVVGPLAKFVGFIGDLATKLNQQKNLEATIQKSQEEQGKGGKGLFGIGPNFSTGSRMIKEFFFGKSKETLEYEKKHAEQQQETVDENAKLQDAEQERARQQGLLWKQLIDQFSGSVTTFSSAVDTQQAWAAWAGEIGKAGGFGGGRRPPTASGGSPAIGGGTPVSSDVGAYLAETDRLIGAKAGTSAAQAMVESAGNASAVSHAGARGLMQIMPATQRVLEQRAGRKFDANNPMDSAIMHRMLMQENVKRFGNVEDAQRAYNGGWDRSKWGNAETAAYVGKINATRDAGALIGGQAKSSLNLRQVQANIAARLGVSVDNISRGYSSRGDVEWAIGQMDRGMQNNINALKRKNATQFMGPQEKERLINEIRDQERGLSMLRQYGGDVVARAKEGERDVTIGDIYVTVNAGGDPEMIPRVINTGVRQELSNAAQQSTFVWKG